MNDTVFLEAYNRLNSEQKKAVDMVEGPVMVVAGPGTGKTQLLTLRIANILRKTDASPENILALTFTEAGARAMRERLITYIGDAAYRVGVYTFHEFCGLLIRQYPGAYERVIGGRLITDIEQFTTLTRILESQSIRVLRPSGNAEYYIPSIKRALTTLKREYVSSSDMARHVDSLMQKISLMPRLHEKGAHKGKMRKDYLEMEKRLNRTSELLFVYKAYEASLRDARLYDFDDMILETILALTNDESVLLSLQEQYQYVLADEHQDVNNAQNRILELLCGYHDRPNICVVGDEKQSIYRFQGASLENFLYFENRFSGGITVSLTRNYRSTQSIIDLAHACITAVPSTADELRIPLTAVTQDVGHIERAVYPTESIEHAALSRRILDLIQRGVSKDEIAVIVRTNDEVEELSRYLKKKGIETRASSESDILAHPVMHTIRTLLTAVSDPHDNHALFGIISSAYSNVPIHDVGVLMSAARGATPLSVLVYDAEARASLPLKNPDAISRVARYMEIARERALIEEPQYIVEYVLHESGLFDFIMQSTLYEGGAVIRMLYDEVGEYVRTQARAKLGDVMNMFVLRETHHLPLSVPTIQPSGPAVSVLTAHKSKGLEFEHVCIAHLTDAKWGRKNTPSYFSLPLSDTEDASEDRTEEDTRKLLYVALTRAKRGLYLSHAEMGTGVKGNVPTRFLELPEMQCLAYMDVETFVSEYRPEEILYSQPTPNAGLLPIIFDSLMARGLSVTALNNFTEDPWSFVFRNVIRVPELKSEDAEFGTIVHAILCRVFEEYRDSGAWATGEQVRTILNRELARYAYSEDRYARTHERALHALVPYMAYLGESLPVSTREEFHLTVPLATPIENIPRITLTGSIDRLDFNNEGKAFRVIDYKTGKPKTRGVIEGTTKSSHGAYKRQLVFYALMLSLQDNDALKTRDGVLSFVEPDVHGRIHEEIYSVTDTDVDELKEEIYTMIRSLTDGTFLTTPCAPDSPYVHYITSLKERGDI